MKPMKTLTIALLAAGVAGAAVTAHAEGGKTLREGANAFTKVEFAGHKGPGFGKKGGHGKRMAKKLFSDFDTNSDGVITQEEIDAVVATRFSETDRDGNAEIGLEEFKTALAERTKPMQVRAFQRFDVDGDGTVTQAETDAAADKLFSRLDRDGDGVLEKRGFGKRGPMKPGMKPDMKSGDIDDDGPSRPESGDADEAERDGGKARDGERDHARKSERDGRRGDGEGRRDGRGFHGKGHHGPRGGMEMFASFDADGDGKLTREEFDAKRASLFSEADSDGSAGLSLEEFGTVWAELGNGRVVRMFQKLDADGSLGITLTEYSEREAELVKHLDRNEDGVLTSADFAKKRQHKDGKYGSFGHGDHKRDHDRGNHGPRGERS
ncbi:calcium-binding protein [Roseibium sp. CAU 1637]|uniref:Calcium-binding protein n=1 Tax=Roseibium limicola TaxID=2816037 RepID=A0A939ENR8_9HYPH|nr:calcium-binding protein [Roseibium limicola]MBO0345287.1 calcium-binding protein [Roseibium limicola]